MSLKIAKKPGPRTKSGKPLPRRVRVIRLFHAGGLTTAHACVGDPLEIEAPTVRRGRSTRITQDAA